MESTSARLEVLGCLQAAGRDVIGVHAPTAQQATLRALLAEAVQRNLEFHQCRDHGVP